MTAEAQMTPFLWFVVGFASGWLACGLVGFAIVFRKRTRKGKPMPEKTNAE